MAPSMRITIEITHARTGRSMKMRASTLNPSTQRKRGQQTAKTRGQRELLAADLSDLFFCLQAFAVCPADHGHIHNRWRDDHAGPHLLQPLDDDAVAGLQAVGDFAKAVVEAAGAHRARDNFVFVVDDVEDLLTLVVVQSSVTD